MQSVSIRKKQKEFGNKSANQVKIHSCKSTAWHVDAELGQWSSASFRHVSCHIQAGCAADTFSYRPAVSPAGSTPSRFTYPDWATGSLGLPSNRIPSSLCRSFHWQKSTSLFLTTNWCLSLIGRDLTQSQLSFFPPLCQHEAFWRTFTRLQSQQVISLSSDPKVKSAPAPFTLSSSPHCQFKSKQAFWSLSPLFLCQETFGTLYNLYKH